MPVSINGNTGVVTGIAVGGLPDGIVDTDMLAANAVTDAKENLSGAAKIWVCFNGTNTSIREHFGVTSITDEGTGDYSLNFSTAMSSTGYCAVYGSSNWETSNADSYTTISDSNTGNRTVSKLNIRCMRMRFDTGGAPTFKDAPFISVAIFGAQ